jgi:hypothetical protein
VCRHGEDGWDRQRVAEAVYSTAHHSAAGEGLLLLAACQVPHTITDYILLTRGTEIHFSEKLLYSKQSLLLLLFGKLNWDESFCFFRES